MYTHTRIYAHARYMLASGQHRKICRARTRLRFFQLLFILSLHVSHTLYQGILQKEFYEKHTCSLAHNTEILCWRRPNPSDSSGVLHRGKKNKDTFNNLVCPLSKIIYCSNTARKHGSLVAVSGDIEQLHLCFNHTCSSTPWIILLKQHFSTKPH